MNSKDAAPAASLIAGEKAGCERWDDGHRVLFAMEEHRLEFGTIRFRGATHFAEGEWFGVELDSAEGKNNGSVKGVSYFKCAPGRGIFCRQARLYSATQIMSRGQRDMMEREPSSDEPIQVHPSQRPGMQDDETASVNGSRAELLERLWCRVDANSDGVLSYEEFERFVLAVDDTIDEETIPVTFEQLQNSYCVALGGSAQAEAAANSPTGLDFAFFVELCGDEGLGVETQQLRDAIEAVEAGARAPPGQEKAAIIIQKAQRAKRAREEAQRRRHTRDILLPAAHTRQALSEGDLAVICILGDRGKSFKAEGGADCAALVAACARALAKRVGPRAARFVTAGVPGVQAAFAHSFDALVSGNRRSITSPMTAASELGGIRLVHVVQSGQVSGWVCGRDFALAPAPGCASRSDEDRRRVNGEIFARLGDVYITFGGGPDTARQASVAASGGACILPVPRTGGASSGMFGFPAGALDNCTALVGEDLSGPLSSTSASVEETAEAVAAIVQRLLDVRLAALKQHEIAMARWQAVRTNLRALCKMTANGRQTGGGGGHSHFSAAQAVGAEEAAREEEKEFEALMATWRPRGRTTVASAGAPPPSGSAGGPPSSGGPRPEASRPSPPVAPDGGVPPPYQAGGRLAAAGAAAAAAAAAAPGGKPMSGSLSARFSALAESPPSEVSAESVLITLDAIEECRKRMEAGLDATHQRTYGAATLLQAAVRGRLAKKAAENRRLRRFERDHLKAILADRDARASLRDIEEAQRRIEAHMEGVHRRVSLASTKLQAAERGRQTRRSLLAEQGGAPPSSSS